MKKRLVYELKNIEKEYHNNRVLKIKHLQFHPGTIYGIIGPMGAGKTTLFKILSGKEKPSAGKLVYEEEEFKRNWLGKIKPFDSIWYGNIEDLNGKRTVSELLPKTKNTTQIKNNDDYFNSKTNKALLSQKVENISPSEKAWLLKCMLRGQDPRVLILDDYGVYLDHKREIQFQKLILKMNKELGTTIILGSHNDRNIKKFASVLIYFDNGHISKIRPGISSKKSKK